MNPTAGRGRARAAAATAAAVLRGAGLAAEVRASSSLAHARELATAAATAGEIVVAVGGDGTAGALAGATAAAGGRWSLIAGGRGNDLSRVLGIPRDPAAAANALITGVERSIDLIGVSTEGWAEQIVAGSVYVGVPSVGDEIANGMRFISGPRAYPIAALRVVARWRPATFTLEGTAGKRVFAGYTVVIANSPDFAAGMKIAPPARIDDGRLDIVTMSDASKITFLRGLAKVSDGSHVTFPQVDLHTDTDLTFTVDRAMPVGADGETLPFADPLPAGQPVRVRVLPGALTVITPGAPAAAAPPERATAVDRPPV
ncbi:MAG: diacylglycerol kinase family protein [Patulibacter sp.]|nr:diacylglycerol kinase family protein [Patulibacter sp.]